MGGSGHWPILRYYHSICPNRLRKITKKCLHQQPPEYNVGALTTALEHDQQAVHTCDAFQTETSNTLAYQLYIQ